MRLSAVIKPIEQLETYKRAELMRETLDIARSVKQFKARHKLTDALKAAGIYISYGEHRIYISRNHVSFEIYRFRGSFGTLPEILQIFEEEAPRYGYQEPELGGASYMYNAMKDIENSLSGEMSEEWFIARRDRLVQGLRELADEVQALDPANYMAVQA